MLLIRFIVLLACAWATTKLTESNLLPTQMHDVASALIAGFIFSIIEYALHITVTEPTRALQQDLQDAGIPVKVDGLLGQNTEAAIRTAINSAGVHVPATPPQEVV